MTSFHQPAALTSACWRGPRTRARATANFLETKAADSLCGAGPPRQSAGSSVGFFGRAVTKACFSDAGSLPLWKDAASCLVDCLTSQVGIGSSWQCFVGALELYYYFVGIPFGRISDIIFNPRKTQCISFGGKQQKLCTVSLDDLNLEWGDKLKYLDCDFKSNRCYSDITHRIRSYCGCITIG